MPTLYVENVPEELYAAIRERAKGNRKSISAEVLTLLAENVPTRAELARREDFARVAKGMRSEQVTASGPFPTSEEMQREDRDR
jgi:plasmid stability protein